MGNWVNWLLVIIGIVCVIAEVALGALTDFDLALIGASLAVGGAAGLLIGSANAGLLASAALALAYLIIFRRWLKSHLVVKPHASNADAVLGKTGVVTKRIAPRQAGIVKLGDEFWRAELTGANEPPRDAGVEVRVESVEGVTLKVR